MQLLVISDETIKSGLDTENLKDDPLECFDILVNKAVDAKLAIDCDGDVATVELRQPSQRIVLLKDVSQADFVVYTT